MNQFLTKIKITLEIIVHIKYSRGKYRICKRESFG